MHISLFSTLSLSPPLYLYLACVLHSSLVGNWYQKKTHPSRIVAPTTTHIKQIRNLQDFLNCCHFWRLKQLIRKDIVTFMPWVVLQDRKNINTDIILEDIKLFAVYMHHTVYLSNSWRPQRWMPYVPHLENKTGYLFNHFLKMTSIDSFPSL